MCKNAFTRSNTNRLAVILPRKRRLCRKSLCVIHFSPMSKSALYHSLKNRLPVALPCRRRTLPGNPCGAPFSDVQKRCLPVSNTNSLQSATLPGYHCPIANGAGESPVARLGNAFPIFAALYNALYAPSARNKSAARPSKGRGGAFFVSTSFETQPADAPTFPHWAGTRAALRLRLCHKPAP